MDGNFLGVAAKCCYVLLYPLKGQALQEVWNQLLG